jgi:hypothetical protein
MESYQRTQIRQGTLLSLLSKFLTWLISGVPEPNDNPDEVPDPEANTLREMETRDEEQTKEATLFKIKF